MLHIKETIIVEGKYDKERLKAVTDAPIICTGGFDLYKNKNTVSAIRTAARRTGIIILTDSDGAGFRIRNYIRQCVGENGTVKQAYIPSVEGKEKRKEKAGKEGLLGVEGMSEEKLRAVLEGVASADFEENEVSGKTITKAVFFEDGLTGRCDSAQRRRRLAAALGLPKRISANAMIDFLNKSYSYEEYKSAVEKLD